MAAQPGASTWTQAASLFRFGESATAALGACLHPTAERPSMRAQCPTSCDYAPAMALRRGQCGARKALAPRRAQLSRRSRPTEELAVVRIGVCEVSVALGVGRGRRRERMMSPWVRAAGWEPMRTVRALRAELGRVNGGADQSIDRGIRSQSDEKGGRRKASRRDPESRSVQCVTDDRRRSAHTI